MLSIAWTILMQDVCLIVCLLHAGSVSKQRNIIIKLFSTVG